MDPKTKTKPAKNEYRKRKRSRTEIKIDILTALQKTPLSKTNVMYKTGIVWKLLSELLGNLESAGYVEKENPTPVYGNLYHLTQKGNKFLRDYQRLTEKFEDL